MPQARETGTVKVGPKVGRNDHVPVEVGKKYKHCHGREIKGKVESRKSEIENKYNEAADW